MLGELLLVLLGQSLFGEEKLGKEADWNYQGFVIYVVSLFLIYGDEVPSAHKLSQNCVLEVSKLFWAHDLLAKKMQDKNHLWLEVIWVIDYVDALQYLLLGFLVLLWASLLEYLEEFFGLGIFGIREKELDGVA